MHTFEKDGVYFHHNGDFSGDVAISPDRCSETVRVPCSALLAFAAEANGQAPADKLSALRAEIAMVAGVVRSLATSVHVLSTHTQASPSHAISEWEKSEERLVSLLAQERELTDGGK
jgi:hypothetical protein